MVGKRFVLLVNPRGGRRRGLALTRRIEPRFANAGASLDVHVTQGPGHATQLARTLDLRGLDGLCLIGGDGTVHEVANGLLQRDDRASIPLGLIPGGTGNSLALHLGCATPHDAVGRILAGNVQPLDAVRLELEDRVTHCVNIVGWGEVVDINRTAERWRWLGRARYAAATLWHTWRVRPRKTRLTLDDEVIEDAFLFVLACNTRFTGTAMQVAPRAQTADGRFDVIFVRSMSRRRMLRLFRGLADGAFAAQPDVGYRQVRSFRIDGPTQDPLNLDGELKGCSPVSAEVIPGALSVIV